LFRLALKKLLTNQLASLLNQIEESRRRFGGRENDKIERLLARLRWQKFNDAESLIRYHEVLLFLCAYPQSARIRQVAEKELSSFPRRVEPLERAGVDLSALDEPEVSGIAGTSVTDTFSYYIVRWLVQRYPAQISIDWDWFESENRLAETWPRFMPLLEEDGLVEANIPYQKWLDAARGRVNAVAWLIDRFESLPLTDKEKAELYDSLQFYIRWTPSFRISRTGMKLPVRKVFYHRNELIARRDISLAAELQAPSPPLRKLSVQQGEAILDLARGTSTMRYRELYGFTHGDPARVFQGSLGRGVDLYITSLPPSKRLPLRAYHAAMIFKNGIAIGYFEGLSLFERMESGFNLYYSFRDGETAWIYARTLNVFHHLLGVAAFALDPYQIGYENEEGIESGAVWFYRKLGFRPTRPELLQLIMTEEKKIAARPSYRTPKTVLRRLAAGPMILELDKSKVGDWDRFQVRSIGLRAGRQMAKRFKGDARSMRSESALAVARLLGIGLPDLRPVEPAVFSDFAVALNLMPDLNRWNAAEKQAMAEIIRAKTGPDETRYLKLMQKHRRLRTAMIRLGSKD
jgi:hypothetical protein